MERKTQLRIKNSAQSKSGDRWSWAIWIEGPEQELDQIDTAQYVLHPTFPEPIRDVSNRATKFRLEGRGWGEFMVHVKIKLKDGKSLVFDHWLSLADRDDRVSGPGIFLSYDRADSKTVEMLRRHLIARGFEVTSGNEIGLGTSLATDLTKLIGRSDAVVALYSEEPSRSVSSEVAEARRQNIPVIPIQLGPTEIVPSVFDDIQIQRMSDPHDVEPVAEAIMRFFKDPNWTR